MLVPNALCDTLLRLAERDFYRPLWSQQVLDETAYAVERIHPEIDPARVRRRITAMADAFEDATVSGWEPLSAGLDLPDPDDRHVLAAAIAGGAQCIVTFNLKDFPAAMLAPTGVEVSHPDEFPPRSAGPPPGPRSTGADRTVQRHEAAPTDLDGLAQSTPALWRTTLRRCSPTTRALTLLGEVVLVTTAEPAQIPPWGMRS